MAKAKSKSVTVTMGDPSPKKHVVRFDAEDADAAIANAYITKAALKELGDPDEIIITIEAA